MVFVGTDAKDAKMKADTWAESVIFDENSPYYMKGYYS